MEKKDEFLLARFFDTLYKTRLSNSNSLIKFNARSTLYFLSSRAVEVVETSSANVDAARLGSLNSCLDLQYKNPDYNQKLENLAN